MDETIERARVEDLFRYGEFVMIELPANSRNYCHATILADLGKKVEIEIRDRKTGMYITRVIHKARIVG